MKSRDEKKNTGKRLGRPPLPLGDVRSKRIVTYVTEDEMARIDGLARAQGVSLSKVCYQLICDSLMEAPVTSAFMSANDSDKQAEQLGS